MHVSAVLGTWGVRTAQCSRTVVCEIFFFSAPFGRRKWYKAVLLGSFQALTVLILANLQMFFCSTGGTSAAGSGPSCQ